VRGPVQFAFVLMNLVSVETAVLLMEEGAAETELLNPDSPADANGHVAGNANDHGFSRGKALGVADTDSGGRTALGAAVVPADESRPHVIAACFLLAETVCVETDTGRHIHTE
jgi:hypothetical protein